MFRFDPNLPTRAAKIIAASLALVVAVAELRG
jgi:hypothetical protein